MFHHFHLSNLKKHWIFPMITGILIVSVSLLLVSIKAVSLMKEEKIQESEKITDTVRKSIDRSLFTLQASAAELMLNNQNITLQSAKSKDEFTSPDTYRYAELMYNIKVANALVEDIYLYYPAQDYIVGTEGSYSSKNYFLLGNRLKKAEYASWKEEILDNGRSEFFLKDSSDGSQKLYFRQQMPAGMDANPMAVLVLCINEAEFGRLLDMSLPHDRSTSISVFSSNGELYLAGNDTGVASPDEIPDGLKDVSSGMKKIETNSYIGWKMPSDYNAFYYVVLSNKKALISYIMPIRRLLFAGIAICTAAGLIVSLYLGRKQYLTIEKTIHGLNEQMLWSLKSNILTDVLNQKLTDAATVKNMFQSGGITLDYMYYQFAVADISSEKNKNQMKECIFSIGKELEQKDDALDVIPSVMGQKAVLLLNYDTPDPRLAKQLEALFQNIFPGKISFAHSEEFMAIEQIVPIYEQTLHSLHGQSGHASDTGLSREKKEKIILKRFKRALLLREYANAGAMVSELFEDYVLAVPDSYVRMSRQYEIVNLTLSCVETEDARYHTTLYPSYLDRLKTCTDMQEIPVRLSEILGRLEQLNSQYTLRQKDTLSHRIKQIIDENYNQNYLGLCYISEQVKVSSSYVSKVFKDEYGIGLVEYMNRLRIDHAKKIMASESLTVKEIAEKVGFTSDIHFIRIFKKYENTTPGVYQKQTK